MPPRPCGPNAIDLAMFRGVSENRMNTKETLAGLGGVLLVGVLFLFGATIVLFFSLEARGLAPTSFLGLQF